MLKCGLMMMFISYDIINTSYNVENQEGRGGGGGVGESNFPYILLHEFHAIIEAIVSGFVNCACADSWNFLFLHARGWGKEH